MMISKQSNIVLIYLLYAWIVFGAYQIGKMIGSWQLNDKCMAAE